MSDFSTHSAKVLLALAPKYQGKGVGTDLLKELELTAKKLGFRMLIVTLFQSNEQGLKLFERLEYINHGSLPGWYVSQLVKELFLSNLLG